MNEQNPTGLVVGQIFLSDASFGHRPDALHFPAGTPVKPQQVNIAFGLTVLNDGAAYLVQATVRSLDADEERLYDFTVTMAGIFEQQEALKELSHHEIT